MTTQARLSNGISLEVGEGDSPEVYDAIAEITDIDGPKLSAKSVKVTSLQSTFEEYIGGLPDGGEVGLTLNLLHADTKHQQLFSDVADRTTRKYRVNFNDHISTPTTFSFLATVTDFAPKASTGAALVASATLKVSGPVTPTWAPAP